MFEDRTYAEHLQNARKRGAISKDDYEYAKYANRAMRGGRMTEVIPLSGRVKEKNCKSWREQNNNSFKQRLDKMA